MYSFFLVIILGLKDLIQRYHIMTETSLEASLSKITENLESKLYILIKNLENKVDDQIVKIGEFRNYVGLEVTEIKRKLESVADRMNEHENRINNNSSLIEKNHNETETRIERLEKQLHNLKNEINKVENNSSNLSSLVSDNINRSMRSTLIIKGLPEDQGETWENTTTKLINTLAEMDGNLNKDVISDDIERAHRGGKQNRNRPRLLFVKFHSWKKSELYRSIICKHSRENKDSTIIADQMYSQDVTKRRNEALKYRRELINNGDKRKMYIRFPAKLMVKNDSKYSLLKEF